MYRKSTKLGALLAIGLAVTGTAHAIPIGAELTISGDTNIPTFALTNTGSLDIVGFNFTIGNTAYTFDGFDSDFPSPSNMSVTVNRPAGSIWTDDIDLSFAGFNPGELYNFTADVDFGASHSVEDFRNVFFGNDGVTVIPNSVITVNFLGGSSLTLGLPENPAQDPHTINSYTFSLTGDSEPIPAPATLLLLATGLAGFGFRLFKPNR